MQIINYSEIELSLEQEIQLDEIFFESSSRQSFESIESRDSFKFQWLNSYLLNYPEFCFLALRDDVVIGYIVGAPDTSKHLSIVENKSYEVFADQFSRYPAHLHINCHKDSRGSGVGGSLINCFQNKLAKEGISGLFIITSPDARNCFFYKKNGLDNIIDRDFNSIPLRFMSRLAL